MNIEKLRILQDRIRNAKHQLTFTGESIEFNMGSVARYLNECRTPACLAGHTVFLWGDWGNIHRNALTDAQEILGLDELQTCCLFTPAHGVFWAELTPAQAVRAIDRLIANPEASALELWT